MRTGDETIFLPNLRPYQPTDKKVLIDLLRLNTPKYFSPDEENDFSYYLDNQIDFYFVVTIKEQIVGCGGYHIAGPVGTGVLAWSLFHPDFQGQSLGGSLVKYRVSQLKTHPTVQRIIVRTAKATYPFYEKMGFKLLSVQTDYWAVGYDLYEMEYTDANSNL